MAGNTRKLAPALVVGALIASTAWIVATAPAAGAATEFCNPEAKTGTRIFSRDVQVWYGSAFTGTTKVRDGTQLSAFIEGGLRNRIEIDGTLDARARAVAPFNTLPQSSFEWVVANPVPPNLPAEANLRTALAAGLTAPVFDAVIDRGTRDYDLGSVDTVEVAPVLVGPTGASELCGADGETVTITNTFVARVSFFELNVRGSAPPSCPPKPPVHKPDPPKPGGHMPVPRKPAPYKPYPRSGGARR